MASKAISPELRQEIEAAVASYNSTTLGHLKGRYQFVVEYKGKFIYLKLKEGQLLGPAARLEFDETDNSFLFAIFKWSRENYDPDEYFFPGSEELDGTLLGALKAVTKAYPPS